MKLKTSIYLPADVTARVKASPLSLSELVRLGLEASEGETPPLDVDTLRRVLREELSSLPPADRSAARYEPSGYSSEPFEDIP